MNFEKVNPKPLQHILKLLLKCPVLKKYTLGFICWANLYYPIAIIAKKQNSKMKLQ